LVESGQVSGALREVPVEISEKIAPEHGDYACNLALMGAKACGMNPRALAELLRERVQDSPLVASAEVAGPGFLNFRLRPEAVASFLPKILAAGEGLARSEAEEPKRINVEFVSVNPNGPITIGSGRGAAFGSALCNVLEAAGHTVHREYYINDGVNSEQMRLFAESVRHYLRELAGQPSTLPEGGYKGEYVSQVAGKLAQASKSLAEAPTGDLQIAAQNAMLVAQREALAEFGTVFDTWFSEQSLHDSGLVLQRIEELKARGVADERPFRTKLKLGKGGKIEDVLIEDQAGVQEDEDAQAEPVPAFASAPAPAQGVGATLWLRSTKFGDDMDRVLRRQDGRLTYIASDVAYHADKFNRPANADKLITILGPDHHGYIGRLQAVLAALYMESTTAEGRSLSPQGEEELSEIEAKLYASVAERNAARAALSKARRNLEVVIYQLVRFLKDGKPAPMRKRDGNIYELRDLQKELGERAKPKGTPEEQMQAGRDVARFYYLMRSHDTTMDFDLDLATQQSDDNPVFYVQYAHARIQSVIAKAAEAGLPSPLEAQSIAAELLVHPRETALLKKIMELPDEVRRCAEDYGVHRLTTYAVELARTYHAFYDACRVIQPDERELSLARLGLCHAAALALRAALGLLGISAPDRMDRAA
jgi:arginyl-tRNA synthetase